MQEIIKKLFVGMLAFLFVSMLDSFSFQVYAYDDEEDIPYLENIYLSEGNDVHFKKNEYDYVVDVLDMDETIYIKPTPEYKDYTVEINGTVLNKEEKYEYEANLIKGKNKFVIKVTNEENGLSTTYNVYVYRGGEKAIYLADLRMNGNEIGYSKDNDFYNIEVDENTDYIKLNVKAEDDSYSLFNEDGERIDINKYIRVNFSTVGQYCIKLTLKDNETLRSKVYTIQFFVGIPVTPSPEYEIRKVMKTNQWVIVNGRWRYNNSIGECLKRTWFYDPHYNSYFYFNSRGNMEVGLINIDGKTYYLGEDGFMRIGWALIDGKWHYFNKSGQMQSGWVHDGYKWYYLNDDGIMVYGWITYNDKNYYLDKDGAMVTGWYMYNAKWYYFDDDGSMKSGEWVKYNDNWYYMNKNGTMRTEWIHWNGKYYYLNSDGTMRLDTLIEDNYVYFFNFDGSANVR